MPELIKRMYDYRMAIENMRAEVTVTYPVDTMQPVRETIKRHFFFAYDRGRIRSDQTLSTSQHPKANFKQYLSTPELYFTRHTSPTTPHINDGNSLFVNPPLDQPLETYDPRRIGTDPHSFDLIHISPFNYDTLLQRFYSPIGEDFNVSIDHVGGERLCKVSCRVNNNGNLSLYSFWINPQKGYNLVRSEYESEISGLHQSYIVTLDQFMSRKGEMWFPRATFHRYKMKDTILEEKIVVDSVEFDVQDETPFTLAGLDIPIGYRVEHFEEKEGKGRTWDGKELIGEPTFFIERANRKMFWIVNGIIFAILATLILYRYIQLLQRRSH